MRLCNWYFTQFFGITSLNNQLTRVAKKYSKSTVGTIINSIVSECLLYKGEGLADEWRGGVDEIAPLWTG